MKTLALICAIILTVTLLSGCNMRTIEDLYSPPKRSESYLNLQSEIEKAMEGLEYSAPLNGEHQQTVQMADLDGDGVDEYLLFAKDTAAERPLRIFIFGMQDEAFHLLDTIECNGAAFDQVAYTKMDNLAGMELIVGRQVSDQVVRTLSVYRMQSGKMEQLLNAGYSRFLTSDLDTNGKHDLFVLRPGEGAVSLGVAELYSCVSGQMLKSQEVPMSAAPENIRRIISGNLEDQVPAVFVASEVGDNAIMTDVYAIVSGELKNVSMSADSGTSVQTMRNYGVYADDIDSDGILELPSPVPGTTGAPEYSQDSQYILRWYALHSDGSCKDKLYTYHNLAAGWYLELDAAIATQFSVSQKGNAYDFSVWNVEKQQLERLFTVYILTGQKREEQALTDNRFVVHRSESTIYAVKLEASSAVYGLTQERIISGFHLIVQDWNTGLT